jgi:hypothetical protein
MSPIPNAWRPMTKARKLSWYGNANVRHIGNRLFLGLPDVHSSKTQAKEQAERWRETGRKARIFPAKGGYRVYVTKKKRR